MVRRNEVNWIEEWKKWWATNWAWLAECLAVAHLSIWHSTTLRYARGSGTVYNEELARQPAVFG